jgi:lysyl-tRNA synthetase class 2
MQYFHFDPHTATVKTLKASAHAKSIDVASDITDKDTWLQLLMSEYIEPRIGKERPCFVYDFPASQASLARIQPKCPPLASRFEVYFQGIELANGFHELQNAQEQRQRFEKDRCERRALGVNDMLIDEFFLAALSHGLPDCAGVALGIDRLIMLAAKRPHMREVLSFDFSRA